MINVTIHINGNVIVSRSARNTSEKRFARPDSPRSDKSVITVETAYLVDDGRTIWHDPDDGASKLAIAMLEGITTV